MPADQYVEGGMVDGPDTLVVGGIEAVVAAGSEGQKPH